MMMLVLAQVLWYDTPIKACSSCNIGLSVDTSNLPLHSVFKDRLMAVTPEIDCETAKTK
jgi:hypothetical protein